MDAIAGLAAAEQYPGGKDGELHVAEHPAGHLDLKWLIEQDKKMKESGITLVALIITIVILIVLAGIVIISLIDNGMIELSIEGTEKYIVEEERERK